MLTVTWSDGVVYASANDKKLYALDAATGRKLWQYNAGGIINSEPVVAGGALYFGSDDGNMNALR